MPIPPRPARPTRRAKAPLLPAADVFAAACPSRAILDHVTSRWGILILIALREDMQRFSELRRRIGGVSEKMLAQSLRALEEDGFVERRAYPEVPPRVEYRLTPLGRGIAAHVETLARWIEDHLPRLGPSRSPGKAG